MPLSPTMYSMPTRLSPKSKRGGTLNEDADRRLPPSEIQSDRVIVRLRYSFENASTEGIAEEKAYVNALISAKIYGLFPNNYGTWVKAFAYHQGSVVGHAQLSIDVLDNSCGHLLTVVVLPHYRKKHLCTSLVAALANCPITQPLTTVTANNVGGAAGFKCYANAFVSAGFSVAFKYNTTQHDWTQLPIGTDLKAISVPTDNVHMLFVRHSLSGGAIDTKTKTPKRTLKTSFVH